MSDLIRIQVLLDKKQRSAVDEIAAKEGKSFSEMVRILLETQLRRRKYLEMRQAAEFLREDYAEGSELTGMTTLDGEEFLNA